MQIIPVASGKGGVGKSLLSANLAISLGKTGKRVILADLDLGASNLHLVIGQQAPKKGLGTFLSGQGSFQELITPTQYQNVSFIAGDSEIPEMTALKATQKRALLKNFTSCDADFLILDLGAGTHLTILDLFLLSPQGIIITAPTVTATLNGYLFLKNAVFRLMNNTFGKASKAAKYLAKLKKDSNALQRLYIPKLIQEIQVIDPDNAALFLHRMQQFKPRLILNMIDDPKDTDRAQKIRRSCLQYLGLDLDHLGVMYRDNLQDKALSSRLPVTVYKPQCVLSQAIFRIAEKILQSETLAWDDNFELSGDDYSDGADSFEIAAEEAQDDFESKMQSIQDLIGTGALTPGELAETIRIQQYEISVLKKENVLLKSKLVKAASMGFKL